MAYDLSSDRSLTLAARLYADNRHAHTRNVQEDADENFGDSLAQVS